MEDESALFRYFVVSAVLFLAMACTVLVASLFYALWSAGIGVFVITILCIWAFGWVVHRLANWDVMKDWLRL